MQMPLQRNRIWLLLPPLAQQPGTDANMGHSTDRDTLPAFMSPEPRRRAADWQAQARIEELCVMSSGLLCVL